MAGYLALVLHAHLPFVRHPEHEKFLEENWLFEAITESYLPLIQIMEGWLRDGMETRLTLTLSPTLCAMLLDPFLQERYLRHLNGLIELAEKEIYRTQWEPDFRPLAELYHQRFVGILDTYVSCSHNLVGAFQKFQDLDRIEIINCAATHALLPLLANHRPSARDEDLGGTPAESGSPNARTRPESGRSCRRRTSAGSSWIRTASCTHARVRVTACLRRFLHPRALPRSVATSSPPNRSGAG